MRSRLQRGVELLFDLGGGKAAIAVGHREEELGGEDVGIARAIGERLAKEDLGGAAAVDIGGVDEVDAEIEGAIEAGARRIGLDADAIGEPGAERDFRNFEIACAELAVFHVDLLCAAVPHLGAGPGLVIGPPAVTDGI